MNAISSPRTVRVIAMPKPFHDDRVTGQIPVGTSIDEIVGALVEAKAVHPLLIRALRVTVTGANGRVAVVPYDSWRSVRPKEGATVSITVVPMGGGGGGGGGKNPLKIILQVIIVIIAIVVSIYFGPIAGMAVMALGNIALNVIMPPPDPVKRGGMMNNNNGASPLSPPTFTITGTRNQYSQYGAIPKIFGTRRMYPLMASRTYTETAGNDQYLRALFCFGYGPLQIEDIHIGTTPISAFSGVEMEVRQGFDDDAPITLIPLTVREEGMTAVLKADAGVIRTTAANATKIAVDIAFRRGLALFSGGGTRTELTVSVLVEYRISGSADAWVTPTTIVTTGSSSSEVRNTFCWTVTSGTYDVRLTRTTIDATDSNSVDQCWWSVIRSFSTDNPVKRAGLSLLAIRIKATEQLNGTIDTLSATVTSLVPTWSPGSGWSAPVANRNPAWAFADAMRGKANKNPVSDSQIDLAAIKEWADACDVAASNDPGAMWTYDYVQDSRASVDSILRTIAATCRARLTFRDGRYSVMRDVLQTTPWQHFTPRNSWGFKSSRPFSQIPHAYRVRWVNPDKDWAEDELMVYSDGYSKDGAGGTVVATIFQQMDMMACTRSAQAWREARYHLASVTLRPATYELQTDIESIVCKAGDLVRVAYDVPMWGISQGRIDSVTFDGGGNATALSLDTSVSMEAGKVYNLRIRRSDGTSLLAGLVASVGTHATVTLSPSVGPASAPAEGDMFMFGEVGRESTELIVVNIKRGEGQAATITMVDAAPALHSWYSGPVPAFESHITHPLNIENVPPPTPVISEVWDRAELVANVPTSITYVAITPFTGAAVAVDSLEGQYRAVGATNWLVAPRTASTGPVAITGLVDGTVYSIRVRSVSAAGVASGWVTATHTMNALALPPDTVAGFSISVLGDTAHLSWTAGTEADISHRRIKFSTSTGVDATWETAGDLIPVVSYPMVSVSVPSMDGTYFIKSVDTGARESASATKIVNTLAGISHSNAVAVVSESSAFAGTKAGVMVVGAALELAPADSVDDWPDVDALSNWDMGASFLASSGTYSFATALDLGAVYTSRLTMALSAIGVNYANIIDDIPDVDAMADWDGVAGGDWAVDVQVRTTSDNPGASPTWSAWSTLLVADYTARAFQWRALLSAASIGVTPRVTALSVSVDMPDRVDGGDNVVSNAGGSTISFTPAFMATPAIALAAKNMATGDYYVINSQNDASFVIRFYNSVGTGVSRSFDWVARGYGYAS